MTRPTILMEMFLAGGWVDITAYVHLPSGISVTRGRDNEQGSSSPGTLSFTVKTDGGRFIVGNPAAPAPFDTFARWAPVRYSINGVRRFTGFVSSAPASWRSSKLSQVPIVCTDLLGMMAMSPTIRSWAQELIEALSPLYWWPLDDPAGSTTARSAVAGKPTLAATFYAAPGTNRYLADAVAFGETADAVDLGGNVGVGALEADSQVKIAEVGTELRGRLQASGLTLPTPFTVLCVFTPSDVLATADFLTVDGNPGLRLLQSGRDLYIVEGSEDDWWFREYTLEQAFAAAGAPSVVAVAVGATSITVRVGSQVLQWVPPAVSYNALILGYRGGHYCHAVVLSGLLSAGDYESLRTKLIGRGSAQVTTWLARACEAAGITAAPAATLDRIMERPALKGSNPAAVAESLAGAAGAMCVAGRDGVLSWIDGSYSPARVDLVEPLTADAKWDADASLYYTEVRVDGTTKAISLTNTFPKRAREIPGLLSDSDQGDYVTWLAGTAEVWGAHRLSGLVVDLWSLPADRVAAYLSLDLRSRVRLTTLPDGMPAPIAATLEGYTETVTDSVWRMALNTAPDVGVFTVEDDVAGLLDSDYRIAPF